jgi:AraC-like DNA-binding protein
MPDHAHVALAEVERLRDFLRGALLVEGEKHHATLPMRYVKHARLQQARVLMLRDQLGASEAADRVGYASPSQFTRDFKRYFGDPPTRYTQRFRDGV